MKPFIFFVINEEILLTREGYYKEHGGQEILNTKGRDKQKNKKSNAFQSLCIFERDTPQENKHLAPNRSKTPNPIPQD